MDDLFQIKTASRTEWSTFHENVYGMFEPKFRKTFTEIGWDAIIRAYFTDTLLTGSAGHQPALEKIGLHGKHRLSTPSGIQLVAYGLNVAVHPSSQTHISADVCFEREGENVTTAHFVRKRKNKWELKLPSDLCEEDAKKCTEALMLVKLAT